MNLFDSIIAGKFGGGGGGGYNWKELDLPYTEGGIVEILPETEVMATDSENLVSESVELEAGKTYHIKYNGVEYVCVAQDLSAIQPGFVGAGNLTMAGLSGKGEPFGLLSVSGAGLALADYATMESGGETLVTIAITVNNETVHKLDNKYIDAEWMATTKEVVGEEILAERKYISISTPVSNVNTASLAAGKKVLVICDGTQYECVVTELIAGGESGLVIGNIGAVTGSGWGSGVPFIFIIDGSEITVGLPAAGSTLSVYAIEEVANKIPEKFLPMYEGESEDA